MKTELILLLLALLPILAFAQNYEQQGDTQYAQSLYEKAAKSYKAAIEFIGETPALKQKIANCTKCQSLLVKAQNAENTAKEPADFDRASQCYTDLYAVHPLQTYKDKASSLKAKADTIRKQRQQARVEQQRREEAERKAEVERQKRIEQQRLEEAKRKAEEEERQAKQMQRANELKAQGALLGVFSVSESRKIVFSKGNLQYQASTKTWRFANKQWDRIGSFNGRISPYNSDWIDLFGWGTGKNPVNRSNSNSDYSIFTDWGNNIISNGGDKLDLWRTLTYDEWEYLFYKRTNAASLCGKATVFSVRGYILLPDDWTTPSGLSFTANPENWRTNVYSSTDWEKMESAGAVFLPCAGMRDGTAANFDGFDGFYWSSTANNEDYAIIVNFFDHLSDGRGSDSHFNCLSISSGYRYYGYSVRLVQDVK